MLNLAIIGLQEGLSALHAATRCPCWNIRALCDLDHSLLEKRKADYGINAYLTDEYDSILRDPRIDVVALFTPDHLHAAHAISALEAGKHVILTKPVAPDLDSAEKIEEACRRHPRQLFFAAHTSRFIPSLMDQRKDWRAGKLGALVSIETSYNADKRERAVHLGKSWPTFSPLHIWLVHPIDIALWYLGDVEMASLAVTQSTHFKNLGLSQPDNYIASVSNPAGVLGLIKGFYSSPEPAIVSCVLRGEAGYSVATYPEMSYQAHFDDGPSIEKSYEAEESYYFPFEGRSHHVGEMQNILEEATRCIHSDIRPSVGIGEGAKAVRLLEQLQDSIVAESDERL